MHNTFSNRTRDLAKLIYYSFHTSCNPNDLTAQSLIKELKWEVIDKEWDGLGLHRTTFREAIELLLTETVTLYRYNKMLHSPLVVKKGNRYYPHTDHLEFHGPEPEQENIYDINNYRHDKRSRACFVYFIQSGDSGPIKIGVAYNVKQRIAGLQTANPNKLNLLATIKNKNALKVESDLHEKFKEHRLQGEWFKPVTSLLSYIKQLS